jgi:NarL family two-component system sensor histidine kinase LiaS
LDERNRLARDLHDSVKQQAFATTMTLGTAKSLQQRDPQGAWQKVDEAIGLSTQVQQELDGLIYQLRPVVLDGAGLGAALHGYVQRWSGQTRIEARVDARGEGVLPAQVEETLFRLTQEALANVSRHSGASRVAVKLISTRHIAILEVADDGRGFDPASVAGKGMGLATMCERIEAVDGTLNIDSAPGQGTRVLARCRLG